MLMPPFGAEYGFVLTRNETRTRKSGSLLFAFYQTLKYTLDYYIGIRIRKRMKTSGEVGRLCHMLVVACELCEAHIVASMLHL